ncbi:hypothetical protein HYX13_04700 [Candidatus Woesearchaeota archaeon]|nr:hypothetical protein [Candidatus Woesearchaeota archaeon]
MHKTNLPSLWESLCSSDNLLLAFRKASKGKTTKEYVVDFEKNLEENIQLLQTELLIHSYHPQPLKTFILRDPKTRKISISAFRDRIVHHALCNIIEPLFEKSFIYDSYANRKCKGTLKAVQRFEYFAKKVSKNNSTQSYVLKADIYHYFESADHKILLNLLKRRIKDENVLWLIRIILANYSTKSGNGMPLGNLTSQFFANVYLHDLDFFVKHTLQVHYYLRYVDDFVLFHPEKKVLEKWKEKIKTFTIEKLNLQLHPQKSRILSLEQGVDFLGFKIFPHHRLLKKRNVRTFQRKLLTLTTAYEQKEAEYDVIYNFLEGWMAYAKQANTYKMRQRIAQKIEPKFTHEISSKEISRVVNYVKY